MPNILGQIATAGVSAVAAAAINGTVATGLTATGSTQAGALSLPAANNFVGTTGSGTGVILNPGNAGDEVFIYNGGANALLVYPPLGGTINNLAANATLSVATLKSVYFVYSGALNSASILSA